MGVSWELEGVTLLLEASGHFALLGTKWYTLSQMKNDRIEEMFRVINKGMGYRNVLKGGVSQFIQDLMTIHHR